MSNPDCGFQFEVWPVGKSASGGFPLANCGTCGRVFGRSIYSARGPLSEAMLVEGRVCLSLLSVSCTSNGTTSLGLFCLVFFGTDDGVNQPKANTEPEANKGTTKKQHTWSIIQQPATATRYLTFVIVNAPFGHTDKHV